MKTPWHLWVIGIVSLLWNAMGAMDYTMTATRNETYMGNFTSEQLEYFYSFPTWVVGTRAIGVWFALLGSILLLMRNRWALWSFIVSFVGMILTSIHTYFLAETKMADIAGPFEMAFTALLFLVALILIWYARRMKMVGVLR